MRGLIDGCYTVTDGNLYRLLALAHDEEGAKLEPSALAGAPGMLRVLGDRRYLDALHMTPERLARSTQLVWATGGSMVPDAEYARYPAQGRALLPGASGRPG